MIPYLASTVIQLGPIPIRTWGLFVGLGFLGGTWVASRRATRVGLDAQVVWDLSAWMLIAAMVGARIFHVLFYDPTYYIAHPWLAIDPRAPGYAIYGGFLACAGLFWWYAKKHALDMVAYADALIWGVPLGCGIGRIGCFLIHDHPGTLTHFVLGVKYPDGQTRHDLGLYLSIVGFAIAIIFVAFNRQKRHPGFWIGFFLLLDGIARFGLDFLRVIDRRVLWLTPTQWLTIPLILIGVWMVAGRTKFNHT